MMRCGILFFLTVLSVSQALGQQCPASSPSVWCSGAYQYDGSGNIKAIGADTYRYDEFGRLVSGTADMQRSGVASEQDYTYDVFGNRNGGQADAVAHRDHDVLRRDDVELRLGLRLRKEEQQDSGRT